MILKLVLLNYRALYSAMFRRSKNKSRGSPVMYILLTVFVALPFAVMFGGMFYGMRDVYFQTGLGWLYFAMQVIMVFSICVITTIFQAQAQVFNAKDNDLLLSMPLRPSQILTARILTMLITEYTFELLIAGPAFVLWILGGYAHAPGVIFFLIGFILTPLFALSVACLIAWVISTVTSRLRHKNILTLILAVAFFGVYFRFSFNASKYIQTLIERGSEIGEAVERTLFPAYHFGRAAADGNLVSMLLFTLCALVPFILIIALLSANFTRLVTTNKGTKRVEYRERKLKTSSAVMALLKKELARYIAKPMYVLNMSMGSVLSLLSIIYFIARRDTFMSTIGELNALIPWVTPALVVTVVLLFCATTSPASASLISVEGHVLWIARSLPVRGRDALLAKLYMHFIVASSPIAVAAIVAAVGMGSDALSTATMILTPVLFAILLGLFGLIFNLLHPKFDWINEIQPVKQGLPVVITMFGSWGVLTLLFVAGAFLSPLISASLFLLIFDVLLAGLCLLLYFWLITAGERRWNMLED